MTVTSEEVAAAKAFLSELPLGIASTTGIAAVRTLLASHEVLETVLRSADEAAGTETSQTPGRAIGALVARVEKLKEALTARGAEAVALKERNALAVARLQEALDEVRRRDDTSALLEEARQRSAQAEASARRAEERLREFTAEVSALTQRAEELQALFGAADLEAQRQTARADAAEAAERAARDLVAATIVEKDTIIAALRAKMAEMAGAAAEKEAALDRRIATLTATVAAKGNEATELSAQLRSERERIEDLLRSGEAQASYAEAQQELVTSVRRELEERIGEIAALAARLDTTRLELRDARARVGELQDALLPFAEMAESYDLADAGWVVDSGWCEDRKHRIVVADFRTARTAALGESPATGSTLAPDLVDDGEVAPSGSVREETDS